MLWSAEPEATLERYILYVQRYTYSTSAAEHQECSASRAWVAHVLSAFKSSERVQKHT